MRSAATILGASPSGFLAKVRAAPALMERPITPAVTTRKPPQRSRQPKHRAAVQRFLQVNQVIVTCSFRVRCLATPQDRCVARPRTALHFCHVALGPRWSHQQVRAIRRLRHHRNRPRHHRVRVLQSCRLGLRPRVPQSIHRSRRQRPRTRRVRCLAQAPRLTQARARRCRPRAPRSRLRCHPRRPVRRPATFLRRGHRRSRRGSPRRRRIAKCTRGAACKGSKASAVPTCTTAG